MGRSDQVDRDSGRGRSGRRRSSGRVSTWVVFAIVARVPVHSRDAGFRWGQVGSASLVSLAHGTNDAQKTMGVITLALIAYGSWTDLHAIPSWVKIACALAIAAGTYVGGWRVIRTMRKGLTEITSPQGLAAETTSAAIVLTSSHLGMALSTTQVATGSILGSGVGARGAAVRWGLAGRMAIASMVPFPRPASWAPCVGSWQTALAVDAVWPSCCAP